MSVVVGITVFRWISKNDETFSVAVQLFEIKERPGTFNLCVCVFWEAGKIYLIVGFSLYGNP